MSDLATYRKQLGDTQEKFAARLGVKQSMVCRLEAGKTRPGLDLAVKIERVTGGAVPVEVWVDDKDVAA